MNNFTPRAQQVLALARKEADRFNHNYVGTEHLLLGLIKLGQGVAVNVLQKMGLDLETVRMEVEKQVGSGPETKMVGNIPYTPRVKKVLALEWDRMIPGHPGPGGRLGTRDDVTNLLAYMQDLAAEVKKAADAGKCMDTAIREVKLPKYATLNNYENWLPMNVERYCLHYSGGM